MSVSAISSVSAFRPFSDDMTPQAVADEYGAGSSFQPEAGAMIADVWSGKDKMADRNFLAIAYNGSLDASLVQIAKSTLGLAANDNNDVFEPPTKQRANDVLQNPSQLAQFAGRLGGVFKSPSTNAAGNVNVAMLDEATLSDLLSMVVSINAETGDAAERLAAGKPVVGHHDPAGLLRA